jgi:serine/threonine protein kinase
MIKRETSVAVSDLHRVSERIKRLAISIDGKPVESNSFGSLNGSISSGSSDSSLPPNVILPAPLPFVPNMTAFNNSHGPGFSLNLPQPGAEVVSVFSQAKENFSDKYEMMHEVGRGGFSIVYKCREKVTNHIYAVKVVDLRPLRLRERFNPSRIRREVDIIKRLRHDNIIHFVDVFETQDQLLMVMEYCPGVELFDVILARKFLNEDYGKAVFSQIARALFYLHSLNILHRDVKPENILILNEPHPVTGLPIAKLLDFGLSKDAGVDGSAAKTFVGTPCYVAPEVEYTSRGLGGTYGLPADCWSAGAVLYVMLVARFPEFEQDITGKVVVRLPPALWDPISGAAKDLIRGLMNTNPAARLTMANVLQHPWLGPFRATREELTALSMQSYELGRGLAEEEASFFGAANKNAELLSATAAGHHQQEAKAVIAHNRNEASTSQSATGSEDPVSENFPVGPLLHLQRGIAQCFDEAHAYYAHMPEVATKVRKGAALCRHQLTESTKMLRKVEQTAAAVLGIFPDLELAVEEGEPQLATELFNMVSTLIVNFTRLLNYVAFRFENGSDNCAKR